MFFNKYVHELVTIDTDFINARFNYETIVMFLIASMVQCAVGYHVSLYESHL